MADSTSPHILIAGASGYVGGALIPALFERFPNARITALSRGKRASTDPRLVWAPCDLFSLKSLEEAVPRRLDLAIYLVHAMGPTAHVDQGSFADFDLIMADNFARAIKPKGVAQVIYLGGLIPEGAKISRHLRSRREVEETLNEYALPTTVFRAGLILGEGGSSFQMLLKLVRRLPVMICPKWTQTKTTPTSLALVIEAISTAALDLGHVGQVYDLAGCRPLGYVDMMRITAKRLGRRRWFLATPFFSPTLSRLWVSLITNSPRALVYPLVESLEHAMIARADHRFPGQNADRDYAELLDEVNVGTKPRRAIYHRPVRPTAVRSVQRLPLPPGRDALWVKDQYLAWLPRLCAPLLRVGVRDGEITFSVLFAKPVLLKLRLARERSAPDRQLLYIQKQGLSRTGDRGRLEFRTVLGGTSVIAAIHDFEPTLPWCVYKYTQALLHLLVMNAFRRHLARAS